ncbi:MAG: hypothetical protein G01um101416_295 [Microgenomates group bacterium Gr01-1014_16]|nr:MAG: hypothetical protein G01um101416_295 [Microgenomates group bacterium Gr01-1014_16]
MEKFEAWRKNGELRAEVRDRANIFIFKLENLARLAWENRKKLALGVGLVALGLNEVRKSLKQKS